MDYEIVQLKEKIVAGISARTNNNDPAMPQIIGLYHNYNSNEKGDYDIMVGK
jgi:predicted transcriptional regulator YdeE